MKRLIEILESGSLNGSGSALANGTVTSYLAGTSTLQVIYQDFACSTPHANPATLDAEGRLVAYTNVKVKLVFKTSGGATVKTIDYVGTDDSDLSVSSATDLAGDGLVASSGTLSVNVDGETLEIESDTVKIKDKVIQTKTTNYTALATDDVILCDATSGAITVTLPAASTMTRRELHIKKTDTSTNKVTVDGNGSETIDSLTTVVLHSKDAFIRIVSDGSNWQLLNYQYGYVISASSGAAGGINSTSYTDATNQTLSLRTNGKSVRLTILTEAGVSEGNVHIADTSPSDLDYGFIKFMRDATSLGATRIGASSYSTTGSYYAPSGAISMIDRFPADGTYTYKVQAKRSNSTGVVYFNYVQLLAEII